MKNTLIILLALITALITPPAFALNRVLSLDGDGDYVETVISGMITDEAGKPIPNASVRLEQNGSEIAQTQTDPSGSYRIVLSDSVRGLYDLSATGGELGDWQFSIRLRDGESRTLNLTLKEAISIEGTLLMPDDKTPHVVVPVQAIRNGNLIDTMLSNEEGKYRFVNLKPGPYQVRCQVLGGYVYHGEGKNRKPESQKKQISETRNTQSEPSPKGEVLQVERGKTLKNIDFRFAPFKKGTWKNYTSLDGLANNWLSAIHLDLDGGLWFGTLGGVSRYDGKGFINFTAKDGLANNWIYTIYRDSDGVMWFGTYGSGVSVYDGIAWASLDTRDGLAGNTVRSIHQDPDGYLWFGTDGGITRYRPRASDRTYCFRRHRPNLSRPIRHSSVYPWNSRHHCL